MKANKNTTLYILLLILISINAYFIYVTMIRGSNEQFVDSPDSGKGIRSPILPPPSKVLPSSVVSNVAEAKKAAENLWRNQFFKKQFSKDLEILVKDSNVRQEIDNIIISTPVFKSPHPLPTGPINSKQPGK